MRARTTHPAAWMALAAAAALLSGACGDSGSAKGSPATGTPAKSSPAKKADEPLPEVPPAKTTEPLPFKDPAPPPAPPPAPIEAKPAPTDPKPYAPEEKKPAVAAQMNFHCDACGKDATASATAPAPTCCGTAMKAKP